MLTIVLTLTFASLATSAALAFALLRQSLRLKALESKLRELRRAPIQAFQAALEPELEHPVLEGLKIGIFIQQDHDRPTFAQLLKDRLTEEDAAPILATPGDHESNFDLVIKGTLACNGYAETYYSANLDCLTPEGPLLAVTEKPPQGGRQINLANELVTRLKRELEEETIRQERLRALSQLRGEQG